MRYDEYLLSCLSEEAGEIIQDIGKCHRFGTMDFNPQTGIQNSQALVTELVQLIAVAEMLVEEGVIPPFENLDWVKSEKKEKVRHWMEHSRNVGQLT